MNQSLGRALHKISYKSSSASLQCRMRGLEYTCAYCSK
uniref:Uncharacterized protein n=1 Tax=Amphimedon queenslandica TaxID=400682 RepID=A0A1X7VLQ7_AMPQE